MATSKIYGYCRASSTDQSTAIQHDAILAAHPDADIRQERVSGTSMKGRSELEHILRELRRGDTLVVHRLDRLARSQLDLSRMVADFNDRGVFLIILEGLFNINTQEGRLMVGMMGAIAQWETEIRKARQADGVAAAKARGVYKGRQPVKADKVAKAMELVKGGMSKQAAADKAGIGVATLYRRLKAG